MSVEELSRAFSPQMWEQRAGRYNQLGWVGASGLSEKLISMASLQGCETVIDAGTGSQAIMSTLYPFVGKGKLFGFDFSDSMLRKGPDTFKGSLFRADVYSIPVESGSADLVVARMVYHHLNRLSDAVGEAKRVIKPGGRLIACEYVVIDEETYDFERRVFDIKEQGRNLWTGQGFYDLLLDSWGTDTRSSRLEYGIMKAYSVKDWMGKSGLDSEVQEKVLRLYLEAPDSVKQKMGIVINDGDALVDRPFAFVEITK